MSQLKINTSKSADTSADTLLVELSGQLDEDSTLSKIDTSNASQIQVDWNGVKSINSCGIREWVKWIETVPKNTQISFQNCPRVVINQVNMVNGFLPEGARIQSFYVPYFCVSCDSITPILLSDSVHYTDHHVTPPNNVPCCKCQQTTELDVVPAKYFRFLKGAPS